MEVIVHVFSFQCHKHGILEIRLSIRPGNKDSDNSRGHCRPLECQRFMHKQRKRERK